MVGLAALPDCPAGSGSSDQGACEGSDQGACEGIAEVKLSGMMVFHRALGERLPSARGHREALIGARPVRAACPLHGCKIRFRAVSHLSLPIRMTEMSSVCSMFEVNRSTEWSKYANVCVFDEFQHCCNDSTTLRW